MGQCLNLAPMNPREDIFNSAPYRVPIQLKTLMPVGTAITIVAVVKYARVSVSCAKETQVKNCVSTNRHIRVNGYQCVGKSLTHLPTTGVCD